MKIILDCNVFISAVLTDGVCRKVFRQVLKNEELCMTEEIFSEYLHVSGRKKISSFHSLFQKLFLELSDLAQFGKAAPLPKSFALPDRDDEQYIAAAKGLHAEIIVTGNAKDFPEQEYFGVRILTPRAFLEFFENTSE